MSRRRTQLHSHFENITVAALWWQYYVGGERTNTGSCQRNSGKEISNGEISLFNTDVLFFKKKSKTVNLFTIFSPTFSTLIWPQNHYFSDTCFTPWNSDEHILRNAALGYPRLKSHSRPFKTGNRACHLLDLESSTCFLSFQQMTHVFMRVSLVLAGLLSFKSPGVRLRINTSPQSNPNI